MKFKQCYGILNCNLSGWPSNYKKGTVFEFITDVRTRIVVNTFVIKDSNTKIHIAHGLIWNWEQFDMIDESKRLYRLIM